MIVSRPNHNVLVNLWLVVLHPVLLKRNMYIMPYILNTVMSGFVFNYRIEIGKERLIKEDFVLVIQIGVKAVQKTYRSLQSNFKLSQL